MSARERDKPRAGVHPTGCTFALEIACSRSSNFERSTLTTLTQQHARLTIIVPSFVASRLRLNGIPTRYEL
jgi:hypothetical protein